MRGILELDNFRLPELIEFMKVLKAESFKKKHLHFKNISHVTQARVLDKSVNEVIISTPKQKIP